jgi:flavin reductase (DIM6/NTAB) family NADH-FMN oxidoreductase RutF
MVKDMTNINIPIMDFSTRPFDLWDNQWFLLTCGDFHSGHFNAMTVSWGSLGIMWNKPFAQVVVRPTRFTFEFMEKYRHFTLCAFPKEYRKALSLLGSKSGRDGDKISESGLTPLISSRIDSPGYKEASLIIECQTIYWADYIPQHFLSPDIELNYNQKDYHRIYFGEILAITGDSKKYQNK